MFKNYMYTGILFSFSCFSFIFQGCNPGVSPDITDIATTDSSFFVDQSWLSSNYSKENVLILDARGDSAAFVAGHVPGAFLTSWLTFVNTSAATTEPGFGELLGASEIGAALADLGVSTEKIVVVYATSSNGWGEAGRIVWMLKMAGINKAKILNGGYNHWVAQGNVTESGMTMATPSDFLITSLDASFSITTDYLNVNSETIKILDTRSKAEYDGDTSAYGPNGHGGWGEKAFGHIPGAIHAPFTDLFKTDETLKSQAELSALFLNWGLTDKNEVIASHCTGGLRSAYMTIILRENNYINAKNYDASFYGWTANDLPVE